MVLRSLTGEDEGVDSFNDFLAIIARCLPHDVDAFARAAYLWAGLHGRVALGDAIPTFPWPTEAEYIERMLEIHITAQAGRQPRSPAPPAALPAQTRHSERS